MDSANGSTRNLFSEAVTEKEAMAHGHNCMQPPHPEKMFSKKTYPQQTQHIQLLSYYIFCTTYTTI